MFGMALKFFELNLEPNNVLRNSDASNRQSTQPTPDLHATKRQAKSSQNIKAYINASPNENFEVPDSFQDKENTPKDQLKHSRINEQNLSQMNIEQLKQSQQKVLEDFKKSISKSLISHNQAESQQGQKNHHSVNYDKVGGLVLSRIQELSQEYLEYSMRKEEFMNQKSQLSAKSQFMDERGKNLSCELIKSIVRSVLLESNEEKDSHLADSGRKSNASQKSVPQNFLTNDSNQRNPSMDQTVTEFIRDLFHSLGLIDQADIQSNSLDELTLSAKKNFNQLKGNDYVEKLHQMLQSVNNIENQANPIAGLSTSVKVSHYYHPQSEQKEIGSSKIVQEKQIKSRKQILIKKEEDKKVKLVSPETFSELQSRRKDIQTEISSAVQFLTKTRRARKFAFGSTEITQVYINFSMDFKFMSYKQVESGFFSQQNFSKMIKKFCSCTKAQFTELEGKEDEKMTMLSLAWNLVNVSKGIKTRNFIKHEEVLSGNKKSEEGLHESRCLSLLFKNRTYDFEFESTEVRDGYFRSIKTMIKSSFDL